MACALSSSGRCSVSYTLVRLPVTGRHLLCRNCTSRLIGTAAPPRTNIWRNLTNLGRTSGTLFHALLQCDTVAVSHAHADHIGALAQHARVRRMTQAARADRDRYVLPLAARPAYTRYAAALRALDSDGAEADDERDDDERVLGVAPEVGAPVDVPLRRRLRLRCIAVEHRVPALAFVLAEQRSGTCLVKHHSVSVVYLQLTVDICVCLF